MKESKPVTEGKTAEQILKGYETYVRHTNVPIYLHSNALKAMEEYASQFKEAKFSIDDIRESCRKQRELCYEAFWDYSCNNVHDEDGFRDAIKEAKEPEFKEAKEPEPTADLPSIVDFLMGAGPYDGYWWGDKPIDKRPPFWWRTKLREEIERLQRKEVKEYSLPEKGDDQDKLWMEIIRLCRRTNLECSMGGYMTMFRYLKEHFDVTLIKKKDEKTIT